MNKMATIARLTGKAPPAVRAEGPLYRAGSTSRRTIGWRAPTTYPNQVLFELSRLRDRSRAAVRDDGYAKGAIDKLVSNIVGTGIKPLSQAEDLEFRKEVEKLWTEWTDQSDADGLMDWYGQQAQVTRCWLEAGECFALLRNRRESDGLPVPLQVQVLEPELCPHDYTAVRGRNRVRAGIEFNRIGKRIAYYFYESRPGDPNEVNVGRLLRVPAARVIHLYKPLRAGQIRGTPHLTQALVRLRELEQFDDATLVRQKLAAMFVAFLRQQSGDADVQPLTGEPVEDKVGDRPVLVLEPGAFQELDPGEDVQFSEPPTTPDGYEDYMRQQLHAVSAATGVPYQVLTGDFQGVNDRTVRVILSEFRRQIQADQHQTVAFQLARPVWNTWMDKAFDADKLGIPPEYVDDPEPWQRVLWMPQGWPYLHPVQDVQATKEAIRNGLTSRSAAVSEQGDDAAVVDAQQAEDNARADELGIKYDSDGRSRSTNAAPGRSAQPFVDPDEPVDPDDPTVEPDDPTVDPDDPTAQQPAARPRPPSSTVNVSPVVNVKTPDVVVNVPEQPAPVVNVAAPPPAEVKVDVAAPPPAEVKVDVAAPPPAEVSVHNHVPEQPAPVVNVTIPDPPKVVSKILRRDKDGIVTRVDEVTAKPETK